MRALVLVLLGGALMYLVWSGLGRSGSNPEEPAPEVHAADEPGPGRMLSLAEMEEALAAEAGESEAETEEPPSAPVAAEPEARPASATGEEGAVGGGQEPSFEWDLGDPVAEGSLLLHDVDRLPGYLKDEGAGLSDGRKTLLFAYGLLIQGLFEHAEERRAAIVAAPDVTAAERDLFLSVLDGGRPRPLAAGSARPNPLLLGARMALLDREAAAMLREQRFRGAAETLSSLMLAEIDAPWPADRETLRRWSGELEAAQARYRWDRKGEWPSFEAMVERGDSLVSVRKRVIAEHPELNICTGLLARANQIGKYLQPGPIRVPTDPVSALVDLSARHVFYLHGGEVVAAWEVAIGRDGKTTPGVYTVGEKLENPPWFQPGSEPVPFGDPENPLGTRWIAWDGSDSLGFHGTWEPETIGTPASEGCIRMRNEEVEELFEILPRGATVEVRP
jgi:hypothetical protein